MSNIEIFKHDSGMKVIYDYDETANTVDISLSVGVGSINESPEERGIAHFIEHVLFTGTDNRTKEQLTYDLAQTGASSNAYTTFHETCYQTKTMIGNASLGLDIMCDMVSSANFLENNVEIERSVILQELNDRMSKPDYFSYGALFENIYKNKEMSVDIIGTKDIVSRLTRYDLYAFYKRYYVASNMILSINGNMQKNDILSILDKYFKEYNLFVSEDIILEPADNSKVIINTDFTQNNIFWRYDIGNVTDIKEKYTYNLISMILGYGMSSLLFKRIRDELGLVYSIYSTIEKVKNNSFLYITCSAENSKLATLLEEVPKVANSLVSITDGDLTGCKNAYLFYFCKNSDRKAVNSENNISEYVADKQILSDKEKINIINSITLDDCKILIKKILDSGYKEIIIKGKDNEDV